MKHFKNIAYSLLAVISFSLISVSAHAGGYGFRIGAYGNGFHVGYNNYYPSRSYGYRSPVIIYRNHHKPYHSYQHRPYQRTHGQGHHYKSYGHASNHYRQDKHHGGHGRSKLAHNKRH